MIELTFLKEVMLTLLSMGLFGAAHGWMGGGGLAIRAPKNGL